MRIRTSTAAIVALTLLLSACADATDTGDGSSTGSPTPGDPAQPVLVVSAEGGFVAVEYALTRLPNFALFADGSLVRPGPQIEIYPPPALPSITVQSLSPAAIQAVVDRAVKAGLGEDHDLMDTGNVGIADVPTTVIRLTVGGKTSTTRISALGDATQRPAGMSQADWELRSSISAFLSDLERLGSWLPEGSLGAERPYRATAANLFVSRYQGQPDPPQQPVAWPLSASPDPGGSALGGYGCMTVAGEDWTHFEDVASGATSTTPWTDAGSRYQVLIRPLLPDETDCPASSV